MVLEHEYEVTVNGKTYRPTMARFQTVFNPVEGLIVAWSAYGAKHNGKEQKPPITEDADLPKLQRWSDVTWLQLINLENVDIVNIRYVFQSPVENKASMSLIARALQRRKTELSTWPGGTIHMNSDEGKAILGSPSGTGVAYLLAQHKRQLGKKTISRVTVFADDGKSEKRPASLIFHVVDA